MTYDYIALIAGGIGPDVWDFESTCSADSMLKAAEYFQRVADEHNGDVVSIERAD